MIESQAFASVPRTSILGKFHDLMFRQVHRRNLIYNTCWEDPRIDRKLMEIKENDRIVMITSAGCNALDYLLDSPAEIHTIDINPRQNALLQLKLAVIRHCDHSDLFKMFGEGKHPKYYDIYQSLRPNLPEYATTFWDKNIDFFSPDSRKGSFYYHGTSGLTAYYLTNSIRRLKRRAYDFILELLNCQRLDEQEACYREIESELWGKTSRGVINHPFSMALVGVPRQQMALIRQNYPDGVAGYVRDKLRHVLTNVPIGDNYFWRVYLTGSYTPDCCPNYLKQENFDKLRRLSDRVHLHCNTLSEYLESNGGAVNHFVLLDHQDWLAAYHPGALIQEWRLILERSAENARILLRSAGHNLGFIPPAIKGRLRFYNERAQELHRLDRVGTYGSLHFAEVA